MPPKKKEVVESKPVLGRFSSHLKIGIVGLPNVGKSTTFNLLTKLAIPAENFPFCTIEPNHARVNVPDDRYKWLVDLYKPKSAVPAFLEVVDIAGLVKGAAQGEGLGNAFLANITAVDGIFHVLRTFEDPDITHVEDRVDPVDDMQIIHAELRAKDIERVQKFIDVTNVVVGNRLMATRRVKVDPGQSSLVQGLKGKKGATKLEKEDLEAANRVLEALESGKDVRHVTDWTVKEVDFINRTQFISAKPVVYLVNMSEKDFLRKKNKHLPKVMEHVKANGGDPVIPYSAAFEERIYDLTEEEKKQECKEAGVMSMIDKIVKTGFAAIQLIYFFTAGADEVKCWQIRKGSKAPQAAGAIHTDFERGFICAEVMAYDDLKAAGDESAVRASGKLRQQGKEYIVSDGDIIHFRFNVTAKGK